MPTEAGAATSSPERAGSQSRQSSHQLPFRFSAAARKASGPAGLTGPITKDAFGLVGGLSRLCSWPLFESTNVVPSPLICADLETPLQGGRWSGRPATPQATAATLLRF